jgi:hypothetical protein
MQSMQFSEVSMCVCILFAIVVCYDSMQFTMFSEVCMYVHRVFVRDVCHGSMQLMIFGEVTMCVSLIFVLRPRHQLCGLTTGGVELYPQCVCSSVDRRMA